MARKCSICSHEEAPAINRALLNNEPYRNIAKQFAVNYSAVNRHKNHIPAGLVKAQGAKEAAQADNLLDQLKELQAKAWELLSKAERAGDLRTALAGVREAKGCLELLAKLQGELAQEGAVNITISAEWIELRALILQAVDPFPEARQSLLDAIQRADPC